MPVPGEKKGGGGGGGLKGIPEDLSRGMEQNTSLSRGALISLSLGGGGGGGGGDLINACAGLNILSRGGGGGGGGGYVCNYCHPWGCKIK